MNGLIIVFLAMGFAIAGAVGLHITNCPLDK